MSQDSGSEEHFALTHSEQVVIQLQSFDLKEDTALISGIEESGYSAGLISDHQFRCLLAIHEGAGNRVGSQDLVPEDRVNV